MSIQFLISIRGGLVLLILLLLSGCSGYQYVASPRYVPLNEKKGELTANLYVSGLQVGYAFSNKFSVFTTGYMRAPTVESVNPFIPIWGKSNRSGDSREINMGLSHFGKKGNFLYEVLIGGGFGDMTFDVEHTESKDRARNYSFYMTADRSNIFIQPNLSYSFFDESKKFRLSLAWFTKFNHVYYHNIQTELHHALNPTANFDAGIEYFNSHTEANLFFIEPGLQVSGGSRTFRGVAQLSPVINVSGHALHYQMVSINLGLSVRLDLLKIRRASK